ncbi:AI-2E family transporter [Geodermatophilus sabuli]|uniref:AI-2E family transporter n=1 Tax=Geodermatophilus sabuli TaxID=1564158 RepID=A0A7K3VUW0_9ACTN|nr:AI-2E family transporter [Geodermatophilus sabuli]
MAGRLRERSTDESGWLTQPPSWLRRGVVFALVAVAGYQVAVWAFTNLRGFLGLLFLAWLFSISVEPLVGRLERLGLRRGAATGIVLSALVAVLAGFVAAFGSLLVEQLTSLFTALPDVVQDVVTWANSTFGTALDPGDVVASLQLTPARIQQIVSDLTPGVVGIVTTLVGLVFQVLTFLLFAFYMSAEGPALRATVARRFPPRQQRFITTVWAITVAKTGGYVVSRLVLAAISSVATGLFLLLLDVPYWLPLALWTGVISQFIPTIGTYLAIAVPALIALSGQPIDALWVVVFGVVYQQVENYLLAPRVTARTVAIHPAVAFGAVIVGAGLFGPMGALVSIPVVAAIEAVIDTYGHRYELVGEDPDVPDVPGERPHRPADESAAGRRSDPS